MRSQPRSPHRGFCLRQCCRRWQQSWSRVRRGECPGFSYQQHYSPRAEKLQRSEGQIAEVKNEQSPRDRNQGWLRRLGRRLRFTSLIEAVDEKGLRGVELRTKQFVKRVLTLYRALPRTQEARILDTQLLRSGTSIGANYRAAWKVVCRICRPAWDCPGRSR